jgi:MarR family transcriptional regulator, 2-MHQ and catechol-resistance regulon repressor
MAIEPESRSQGSDLSADPDTPVGADLPAGETAGSDADLYQHARALHQALSRLRQVYEFRDRERICCYDVSVTQCRALEVVMDHEPLSMGGLAQRLLLDKSTVSRVVGALERKGYLEREAHPQDARSYQLSATPSGKELRACIDADLLAGERAILEDLSFRERRAVIDAVLRLSGRAESIHQSDQRSGHRSHHHSDQPTGTCAPPSSN